MHIRLLYKKVLCVFLSLMIVIGSTQSAFASTANAGGWSLGSAVWEGAAARVAATKTAGGIALSSAISYLPSASRVGGLLIKGSGYAAVALAVTQIAGDSVDWLLDPANNAVTYNVPIPEDGTGVGPYYHTLFGKKRSYGSVSAACNDAIRIAIEYRLAAGQNASGMVLDSVTQVSSSSFKCNFSGYGTGSYSVTYDQSIPIPEIEKKSIPIDTVAAKVLDNAKSGNAPSQSVALSAVGEAFDEGDLNPALNAAANAVGADAPAVPADPAVPVDPADPVTGEVVPPIDYTGILSNIKAILVGILGSFSDFTDWYKTQWATFTGSFTELKDWAMAEPEPLADEPVLIGDDSESLTGWQEKANAGYVNFDGQCPNDVEIPITFMGSSSVVSLSYIPFCHFASLIKYAVIMGAWIGALMIISVGRSKE